MAIVANARDGTTSDSPLTTPNRTVAVSPVGATTPQYAGEIVLDTNSNKLWKAMGLTNSTWVDFATRVVHN